MNGNKMKNVITAIGNPYLNEKLKQNKDYQVILRDIQYQDGVLEILEETNHVDLLLLSSSLLGEYSLKTFIQKILEEYKNIEIIVFLINKREDDILFLNSKGIYKIYEDSRNGYNEYLESVFLLNHTLEVTKEIESLKEIILQQSGIRMERKSFEPREQDEVKEIQPYLKDNKIVRTKKEIIVVAGNFGVGKSIFSTILAQYVENKNIKTLLIDFDFYQNSIGTILGIKAELKSNEFKIQDNIHKVSKYLDVLIGTERLCDDFYFQSKKFREIIENLEDDYDCMIIDISSNYHYRYVKNVLMVSDKILFLIEPNLSQIKKAESLLEIYVQDFNIEVHKIKIIFNKVDEYQIEEEILKEAFSNFEVIGNVTYDKKYTEFINKEGRVEMDWKEYERIYNSLF